MTRRSEAVSRRAFLRAGAVGVVGAHAAAASDTMAIEGQTRERPNEAVASVKALVFDVFGTVVDWRASVAREVELLAKRKGLNVDGGKFADAWRAQYGPSMNRVRTGELPWTKLERLHRMMLETLGRTDEAAAIERAVEAAVHAGQATTDIGGALGTREVGDWIAEHVRGSAK